MNEEKWLQELELAYCIVSTPRSLLSLFAENSDSHMSLKDHTDIVSSIADRKHDLLREPRLDHSNYISLLFWWHSASKDNVNLVWCIQEKLPDKFIPINCYKRVAGNYDRLFSPSAIFLDSLFDIFQTDRYGISLSVLNNVLVHMSV